MRHADGTTRDIAFGCQRGGPRGNQRGNQRGSHGGSQGGGHGGGRSASRVVHKNASVRATINLELVTAATAVCRSVRVGTTGATESRPGCQAEDRTRGELFAARDDGRLSKMIGQNDRAK